VEQQRAVDENPVLRPAFIAMDGTRWWGPRPILAVVAGAIGATAQRLRRHFIRVLKMTPREFLSAALVARAKERARLDQPIRRVAKELRYACRRSLDALFKRRTKCSFLGWLATAGVG
jgi:AraC-like DNA-binding protein